MAQLKSFEKYELNPRGNLWLKDENNFGAKLLSKMGWSQGKGLGKNEDGIVEHIKMRAKHSNSGVGWKENPLLSITAQTEGYESLLSQLNEGHLSTRKLNSVNLNGDKGLEQRSQKFRKRLHYQKFVRGKDVSRYSECDMKSIFILKKSNNKSKTAKDASNTAESSPLVNSESVDSYKSSLNITEYFAKKMQEKIRSIAKQTGSVSSKSQDAAVLGITNAKDDVELEIEGRKKSRKKRKRSEEELSNSFQGTDLSSQAEELKPRKKRKKDSKKSKKLKISNGLYTNLKSCLKSKQSVNFAKKKEVSFNESVSYRIIESELNESENDSDVESRDSEKHQSKQTLNGEQKLAFVNNEAEQELTVASNEAEQELTVASNEAEQELTVASNEAEQELTVASNEAEQELTVASNEAEKKPNVANDEIKTQNMTFDDPLEKYECFNIPKFDSSNYNSWIDSQRQALKMSVYKNMMKKIKKHPILKSTNLLEIKGYGNWGF